MSKQHQTSDPNELELKQWIISEWYEYHEEKFPLSYKDVMDSLNSFAKRKVAYENIRRGVTAGFAATRAFDSDYGRWKYCGASVWNIHNAERNFEDVVKEETASHDDSDQP